MTPLEIKEILAQGEKTTVEFKSCRNEIGNTVYESVCSFLNHSGGFIFIGVNDDGEVIGVDENKIEQMKKNFINVTTNPNLFSPIINILPEEIEIDGKNILYLSIDRGLSAFRYKGHYYDRNGDADIDITDQTGLIAQLYARKENATSEEKIVPFWEVDDLDDETFNYCKKLVVIRNTVHPWLKMSNTELLKSCGLIAKDPTTGKEGIRLAALLLFGTEEIIASFAPHYRIEGLYRNMSFQRFELNKAGDTRYDDRITIRKNLISAYGSLIEFVYKYLPEKFYIEEGSTQRGDLEPV